MSTPEAVQIWLLVFAINSKHMCISVLVYQSLYGWETCLLIVSLYVANKYFVNFERLPNLVCKNLYWVCTCFQVFIPYYSHKAEVN